MKPLTSASTHWILGSDIADQGRSKANKRNLLAQTPDLPSQILLVWSSPLRYLGLTQCLGLCLLAVWAFRSTAPFVLEVSRCSRFGTPQAEWDWLMEEPTGLKAFRRD